VDGSDISWICLDQSNFGHQVNILHNWNLRATLIDHNFYSTFANFPVPTLTTTLRTYKTWILIPYLHLFFVSILLSLSLHTHPSSQPPVLYSSTLCLSQLTTTIYSTIREPFLLGPCPKRKRPRFASRTPLC
jgi:hypothetical protein